jgi:CRISPR/Cas system-associated exonuclease Cas4 (RecB family)
MIASSSHDFTDVWANALATQVERVSGSNPDLPTSQWRRAGRKTTAKPHGEDLEWWQAEGLQQLNTYYEWLSSSDWTFVEHNGDPLIEFNVSGNLGDNYVKGFIDSVMTDGEKTMLIDYKSGSRTPFGLMQLGVYRILLRNLTGVDATHGVFWMTRKGEPTEPAPLDRYTNDYVSNIFAQFHSAVDNRVFIPNEGSHCWSCDVRSACYIQGGVDAWKWDPDHPQYGGGK